MNITEVRIQLVERSAERLLAFCTVTFDDAFVVRDIRIVLGERGPFVAMPSRKHNSSCPRCHSKNTVASRFCNECGARLSNGMDGGGNRNRFMDIAHPINADSRREIEKVILDAYTAAASAASTTTGGLKSSVSESELTSASFREESRLGNSQVANSPERRSNNLAATARAELSDEAQQHRSDPPSENLKGTLRPNSPLAPSRQTRPE
jgi:stage V sporulation protein G